MDTEQSHQASGRDAVSSSSSKERENNDFMFLGYLSDDFSYLRRFLIAAEQMVRLLQTELAKNDTAAQEKLVNNIEIAKETLTEAGVSPRPFIPCPPHLTFHRQAYFDMLTAARSLVPHIKDADTSLRLRRLLLPLTSTARFRFPEATQPSSGMPLPTWWSQAGTSLSALAQASESATETHDIVPLSRRRLRRPSATATPKLLVSSSSATTTTVTPSRSRTPAVSTAAGLKSHRASPYPIPPSGVVSAAILEPVQTTVSSGPSGEYRPPTLPPQPYSELSSHSDTAAVPPQPQSSAPVHFQAQQQTPLSSAHANASYPSTHTQRDLGPSYAAFQKNLIDSTTRKWDLYTQDSRNPPLGGVDCNLPQSADDSKLVPARSVPSGSVGIWGEDASLLCRNWAETGGVPTPSAGLTWCTSWDDAISQKGSEGGTAANSNSNAVIGFPGELTGEKVQAEPICVIM